MKTIAQKERRAWVLGKRKKASPDAEIMCTSAAKIDGKQNDEML